MSYSTPIYATYRFTAASVTAAATLGRFIGPAGKEGVVVDISYVITTGVTVAASNLIVGFAGTTNAYGTTPVPVAAADSGGNAMVRGATAKIPPNSVVLVGSAGGATAGAVNACVVVAWF